MLLSSPSAHRSGRGPCQRIRDCESHRARLGRQAPPAGSLVASRTVRIAASSSSSSSGSIRSRGVRPFASTARRSAPARHRLSTPPTFRRATASWRGVVPSAATTFGSAPASRSKSTAVRLRPQRSAVPYGPRRPVDVRHRASIHQRLFNLRKAPVGAAMRDTNIRISRCVLASTPSRLRTPVTERRPWQ